MNAQGCANGVAAQTPAQQKEYIYIDAAMGLVLDAMIQNGESVNTMASIIFHSRYMHSVVNSARYAMREGNCIPNTEEFNAANLYAEFSRIRMTIQAYVDEKYHS